MDDSFKVAVVNRVEYVEHIKPGLVLTQELLFRQLLEQDASFQVLRSDVNVIACVDDLENSHNVGMVLNSKHQ